MKLISIILILALMIPSVVLAEQFTTPLSIRLTISNNTGSLFIDAEDEDKTYTFMVNNGSAEVGDNLTIDITRSVFTNVSVSSEFIQWCSYFAKTYNESLSFQKQYLGEDIDGDGIADTGCYAASIRCHDTLEGYNEKGVTEGNLSSCRNSNDQMNNQLSNERTLKANAEKERDEAKKKASQGWVWLGAGILGVLAAQAFQRRRQEPKRLAEHGRD